jgi:hypothetical protein
MKEEEKEDEGNLEVAISTVSEALETNRYVNIYEVGKVKLCHKL